MNVSVSTIRRTLRQNNLRGRLAKKSFISRKMEFAREYLYRKLHINALIG